MTLKVTIRRKPVPVEWREEHHYLVMRSHRSYGVQRGSSHYSRAGGTCACGATFGTDAGNHTLHAADVRDYWMDHVAKAYHGDDYYIRTEVSS